MTTWPGTHGPKLMEGLRPLGLLLQQDPSNLISIQDLEEPSLLLPSSRDRKEDAHGALGMVHKHFAPMPHALSHG